ncbi:3-deoxy-D-manno-octulosonic acid transferase [Prosthecochloris sp. CIB 2401]|uniref:3-deoxy-D-manno-octulosonic acid transferase n=1 Tax=Prosthecochloris sp. CIB 2401 TaxID=1868325 RepID=UPI00080AACB0|nr:glycosyltransferase N-terminal domain-containing protein [Prosthecochloris sp. CIB 2401]ANT65354.1 3-deoxy-D-manno-octulosonic acid transferase [Prosthecochloris sp. CIB 2401]
MQPVVILYKTLFPPLLALAKAASLFSPKLRQFFAVRKSLMQRLEQQLGSGQAKQFTIWIHAASAGEFEQARPVITELKQRCPECRIAVSFQSVSGYSLRKDYPDADLVFYHPADTARNAKKLITLLKPDAIMVMRYDLWLNHLLEASRHGARLLLAAAVLHEHSSYTRMPVKLLYQAIFSLFHSISTVSEDDRKRFETAFGLGTAKVSGDPRCDQVLARSRNSSAVEHLRQWLPNRTTIVAGSTWEPDEERIIPVFAPHKESACLVIAPHDVSGARIASIEQLLARHGIDSRRLSQINEGLPASAVLIIDTIGILVELYSLASIAYVGGGFGINVHNTLEPAVYGLPLIYGPNHRKSPEAEELLQEGAATTFNTTSELASILDDLLTNGDLRQQRGTLAATYVRNRIGATRDITRELLGWKQGLTC